MIHKHTITLAGPAADGRGLSGHVLRDLFDVLVQGRSSRCGSGSRAEALRVELHPPGYGRLRTSR